MLACIYFLHILTLVHEPDCKGVCWCCGTAFLSYCLLHSPPLFPAAAQESDRGSGPELAQTLALSAPRWMFRGPLIPCAGAIGCFPASWLHRLNGSSSVERLHSLASVGWISSQPPRGQDRVDTVNPTRATRDLRSGSRFGVKLVVLHRVTVLIARGISMLHLVCFFSAVRVTHLSLVGGVKQPWGGHILQHFQDYRNMKSPSFTP